MSWRDRSPLRKRTTMKIQLSRIGLRRNGEPIHKNDEGKPFRVGELLFKAIEEAALGGPDVKGYRKRNKLLDRLEAAEEEGSIELGEDEVELTEQCITAAFIPAVALPLLWDYQQERGELELVDEEDG